MKLVITCTIHTNPDQLAGCGIVAEFTDQHGRTFHREYGYALGFSQPMQSYAKAVRLALATIAPRFRNEVQLRIDNKPFLDKMIQAIQKDGGSDDTYVQIIKWLGFYNNYELVYAPRCEIAYQLAQQAADTQMHRE